MSTPAQIVSQGALGGFQQGLVQARADRLAKQAKVSAIVGDSLNALPLPKDENGNPDINNPAYDQILAKRKELIGSLMDIYGPTQHANIIQRVGGLIMGNKKHAEPHPDQALPAMGTGPHALAAQQGTEQAAQAQQDLAQNQIPQQPMETVPLEAHPFAPLPSGHPANKIQEGLAALKNHLSAFAHPDLGPRKDQGMIDNLASSYVDPQQLAHERSMELWGLKGENALKVQALRNDAIRMNLQARPPRLLTETSIPNFLKEWEMNPDMTVVTLDGTPIPRSKIMEMPQGMIVREFAAGGHLFYAVGDQHTKTGSFGGITYQIPSIGSINPETATPLGVAPGALPKKHEVLGANPGDNPVLHSGPAETPGMIGAPATPPLAAPAPPTEAPTENAVPPEPEPKLKERPQAGTITLPASPSAQAATEKANKGRSQSRQIPTPQGQAIPPAFAPHTALQQARPAMPVISAMEVVGANIFGRNGEQPIWSNAWMYDKPEIRKALNNALTLNALKIPGTEDPTLMQTLATAVGATQWSQEQINRANVEARKELERVGGPEALKQFAREAAMQEDLPALRAATKASAAQGSLALAVRAAPVYNISSAQDFRNQLGTLLSTASSSMRGYPMINPKYVDWWDRGVSAAKGGPVSSNAPKAPTGNQQIYEMNGKRYTYNGTGAKSDIKNYTEVPNGR